MDTAAPPNTLTFELVSGPTSLTVNPEGLISWTPQHEQSPSTNTVVVRTFDDGMPTLSTTNSFVVIVVPTEPDPRPVIEAITISNGVVTVTWTAVAGGDYKLQYRETLGGTNWSDVPPNLVATGTKASLTDTVGVAAQRFYRVALLP